MVTKRDQILIRCLENGTGCDVQSVLDMGLGAPLNSRDNVVQAIEGHVSRGYLEFRKPDVSTDAFFNLFGSAKKQSLYFLTPAGERYIDLVQERDSKLVESNARVRVLKTAFSEVKGVHYRQRDLENIGPARRKELFASLVQGGLLEMSGDSMGGIPVKLGPDNSYYKITIEGERALDKVEGRDSEALERHAKLSFMQTVFNAASSNVPVSYESMRVENVGVARQKTLLKDLVDLGHLQEVSSGAAHPFGNWSSSYEITPAALNKMNEDRFEL